MTHEEIIEILKMIDNAYSYWMNGERLPVPSAEIHRRYEWLNNDAPFGLLVHNCMDDPIFIYANKTAQKIFNYTLDEFLVLPSRLSAADTGQSDRNRLLKEVEEQGISEGYTGTRINKQGEKFNISKGSIWKVIDESHIKIATAAMIWV
ncbi:MEKHLA domain-containing protein [Orbus sturtevantii]|uniref:MEKHLA domain-containing protein n=1 Tax=Orbus sturtevantii TaxID=3074109 RepID=UPI00370D1285